MRNTARLPHLVMLPFFRRPRPRRKQLVVAGKIKIEELKIGSQETQIGKSLLDSSTEQSVACATTTALLDQVSRQRATITELSFESEAARTALDSKKHEFLRNAKALVHRERGDVRCGDSQMQEPNWPGPKGTCGPGAWNPRPIGDSRRGNRYTVGRSAGRIVASERADGVIETERGFVGDNRIGWTCCPRQDTAIRESRRECCEVTSPTGGAGENGSEMAQSGATPQNGPCVHGVWGHRVGDHRLRSVWPERESSRKSWSKRYGNWIAGPFEGGEEGLRL